MTYITVIVSKNVIILYRVFNKCTSKVVGVIPWNILRIFYPLIIFDKLLCFAKVFGKKKTGFMKSILMILTLSMQLK